MESTASFWKPLYNILEASELDAIIVNARHMKNVPGRKTDVKDAEWIADLLQHGLLQASILRIRISGNFGSLFVTERVLLEKERENLTAFKRCWKEQTSTSETWMMRSTTS